MTEGIEIQLSDEVGVSANELLTHHLLVLGATGAGKSTSAVKILHNLMMANQTTVVIDPTGEYTGLPNAVVAKLGWNAFIDYERLTGADFAAILGVTDPEMVDKLTEAVRSLKIQRHVKKSTGIYKKVGRGWDEYEADLGKLFNFPQSFDVSLLADQLQQEYAVPANDQPDFDLIGQEIDAQGFRVWHPILRRIKALTSLADNQRLFNFPGRTPQQTGVRTDVMYLLRLFAAQKGDHKILVIDLSGYAHDIQLGQTLVSLLAAGLLREKMTLSKSVPVVLLLDEAHRYLSADAVTDGNGILRIGREGRKFGLYLLLTTQSPTDLPVAFLGQFGALLIHRLNTQAELAVLPGITEKAATKIATFGTGEAYLYGSGIGIPRIVQVQPALEMGHRTTSPKFF